MFNTHPNLHLQNKDFTLEESKDIIFAMLSHSIKKTQQPNTFTFLHKVFTRFTYKVFNDDILKSFVNSLTTEEVESFIKNYANIFINEHLLYKNNNLNTFNDCLFDFFYFLSSSNVFNIKKSQYGYITFEEDIFETIANKHKSIDDVISLFLKNDNNTINEKTLKSFFFEISKTPSFFDDEKNINNIFKIFTKNSTACRKLNLDNAFLNKLSENISNDEDFSKLIKFFPKLTLYINKDFDDKSLLKFDYSECHIINLNQLAKQLGVSLSNNSNLVDLIKVYHNFYKEEYSKDKIQTVINKKSCYIHLNFFATKNGEFHKENYFLNFKKFIFHFTDQYSNISHQLVEEAKRTVADIYLKHTIEKQISASKKSNKSLKF